LLRLLRLLRLLLLGRPGSATRLRVLLPLLGRRPLHVLCRCWRTRLLL
jgi:hypothetical protein